MTPGAALAVRPSGKSAAADSSRERRRNMHRDVARLPPVCKCCMLIGPVTGPSARHRQNPIHDPLGTNFRRIVRSVDFDVVNDTHMDNHGL
jgi:hypothetical protein